MVSADPQNGQTACGRTGMVVNTGRLCRPFARLFCVQWEEQRKFYPGSVVVGPLL